MVYYSSFAVLIHPVCLFTFCVIVAAMWAARNDAELAEQEEGDSIQQ